MMRTIGQVKRGFIMLTTVLLVALLTALGSYLFQRSMIHIPYMQVMANREKAHMLALSGIEIVMGQLSEPGKEEEKKEGATPLKGAQPVPSDSDEKKNAQRLMPLLNRWQKFVLKESIDGLDGELGILLCAEDGKIAINELYDFKKHAFKNEGKAQQDMQKFMKEVCARIEKRMGGKELFEGLNTFLKKRKEPLDDVTELLTIPAFKNFKYTLFYEPPKIAAAGLSTKSGSGKERKPFFLTDLFTPVQGDNLLQPWALSPTVQELCELDVTTYLAANSFKERVTTALKNFKQKMTWPADWKASLGVLYGKDFTSLPNSIQSMLDTTFEPMTFSVVIYGTVNGVTQRLFSIIERQKVATKSKKKSYIGKMKRLYWF